ncbi:hypothetical protein [Algibacter sp. L1A34]|uniref:DUF922 domain-containing protein n=1 Tax=Algibacter sp. L1A34 TaxID=2686365 RepID=UPI00131D03D8|nr:hypothetical protein [Algibacter sp. L1A34]
MSDSAIIVLVLLIYFSPVFYQLYFLLKERNVQNKILLKKLLRFTKYSVLVLLFITMFFGALSHTNFLNYEEPLTFDKYNQITFKNFRGLEFFKKSLYGNERFAYVVTSIDVDIDENSATIQSLFHPSRSFVYKRNIYSEELLTHEKYHFKITELFARKAKAEISSLSAFEKARVEEIVQRIRLEERAFQKKYDYDTFHSYVLREQKIYEKEVDSLLTSLTKYESPKIVIDVKN